MEKFAKLEDDWEKTDTAAILYHIADILRSHENLVRLGDCNTCKRKNCEHRPYPGQTIRINCFDYIGEEEVV